jgi:type IV secretion system protein VirB9
MLKRGAAFASGMFLFLSSASTALAELNPYIYPTDSKIVVFPYSSVQTYAIKTRPNSITDIEVPENETISAFAIGDTVQWVVESTGRHVLVKPIEPGLKTSATLITDRRTYQITMESVGKTEGGWYQQVTWNIPNIVFKTPEGQKAEVMKNMPSPGDKNITVDASRLNLDYTIKGNAKFRPSIVFDDGKKTYFRFQDVQEYPTIWAYNDDGRPELVNYVVLNNGYVAIDRVSDHTVLALGKKKLHIYRK